MSRVLVQDAAGSVTLSEHALAQIVTRAAESVDGVRLRRRRRLALELEGGHARAELELAVEYGRVLPDVARSVQQRVTEALAAMCDAAVDAVDVAVEELHR
jgi:uncharacterized alkaline shock family protein YloU